jgi:hypothetical protein
MIRLQPAVELIKSGRKMQRFFGHPDVFRRFFVTGAMELRGNPYIFIHPGKRIRGGLVQ